MKIQIDRSAWYALLGVIALAGALGVGVWLGGGGAGDQVAAPASQDANLAQPADTSGQANPAANPMPPSDSPSDVAGAPPADAGGMEASDPEPPADAGLEAVLAGGEISAAQDAAVERIPIEEALPLLDSDDVIWVDTRTAEEFSSGHIQGAISIPAYQEGQRLAELPQEKEIIVYCA